MPRPFDGCYPGIGNGPAHLDLLFQHTANALAAFEIGFWTLLDSPWDRYVAGDDTALWAEAKRGALLFFGAAQTIAAILVNLDPLLATPLVLSDQEVNQILAFLEAFTDPAAADLSGDIPESVPSGLPVDD